MDRNLELFNRWSQEVAEPDLCEELRAMQGDAQAIREAFYKELEFGTAGLRGIIGAGSNRMNVHTIGRATQGFSDYLVSHFDKPSVVIGRDSRNKGESFARRAAEVFAANGIKTYVFKNIIPTPVVSFSVRELSCAGGVNITASHNPAAYNGYKTYDEKGCQIATSVADAISASIAQVDTFNSVKRIDFDETLAKGLIEWVPDSVVDHFLDAVQACSPADGSDAYKQPLKVVYTPLNGTGYECVTRILHRVGIDDIVEVSEQIQPDGDFPTCPYPNPEMREALELALKLAKEVHPDLVLATDPDADRLGVAVKDGDNYVLLSGNEVGVLLLDYMARTYAEQAKASDKKDALASKLAVTTIVSSVMVDALAEYWGFNVRRVLTGFKYIGGVIGELEEVNQKDRFLFGYEESYGYLSGTHVRDKDAVNASMLMCQMAQYYRAQGMSLLQAMEALYEKHGYFLNQTLSFEYPGADGSQRMQALMDGLRQHPPADIAGLKVQDSTDFLPGINDLPPANVIEFKLEGLNKIIVRPSGTEPKIKVYLFAKCPTRSEAQSLLDELAQAATDLLSS